MNHNTYVVFDLDGTLCDDAHRLHLLKAGDFDGYHELLYQDQYINSDLFELGCRNAVTPVFVTSRPEKWRERTSYWIQENIKCSLYILLMRPDGNMLSSPNLKVKLLREAPAIDVEGIVHAYDDREDVLKAYWNELGIEGTLVKQPEAPLPSSAAVPQILRDMADTYQERNRVYRDNYKVVGKVLEVLFPEGVSADLIKRNEFHLLVTKVAKLTRFVESGLTHKDSIHDDGVYSAMIESLIKDKK